jgi:hypothetical protein
MIRCRITDINKAIASVPRGKHADHPQKTSATAASRWDMVTYQLAHHLLLFSASLGAKAAFLYLG